MRVCTFKPGFFSLTNTAAGTVAPVANTGGGKPQMIYVGSLSETAVRYAPCLQDCASGTVGPAYSAVLNIGATQFGDPWSRLANNKGANFQRLTDAWRNNICPVEDVNYALVADHTAQGVDLTSAFDAENCMQFLFGFAAGALPLMDRIQSPHNNRLASLPDLRRIAQSGIVANWSPIFPLSNAVFHSRLLWLLHRLHACKGVGQLRLCGIKQQPGVFFDKQSTGLTCACDAKGGCPDAQQLASLIDQRL